MTVSDDPWADENRPADEDELDAAEDAYAEVFCWHREGSSRDEEAVEHLRRSEVERRDRDDLEWGEEEHDDY